MLRNLIIASGNIIDKLIVLTAGIALLLFLWGVARFIFKSGDPKAQEEGKNRMIWGIVALFVMVSVWGIVNLIRGELGLWDPFQSPDSTFPTYSNPGFVPGSETIVPDYNPNPVRKSNSQPCNPIFNPDGCVY